MLDTTSVDRPGVARANRSGMGTRRAALLAAAIGLLAVLPALATRVSPGRRGTIVEVVDGDTAVLAGGMPWTYLCTLRGIEAPELAQPRGDEAREALVEILARREIEATIVSARTGMRHCELTPFDPELGRDDRWVVQREMIRRGLAWTPPGAPPELEKLEAGVRVANIGLWLDPDPTPPWEFRHERAVPELGVPARPEVVGLKALRAVDVPDGDSLVVMGVYLPEGHTARFFDFDAPELDQPFGPEAREALRELTAGESALLADAITSCRGCVEPIGYRRLQLGGREIAPEMIRRGLAWDLRTRLEHPDDGTPLVEVYGREEREAREAGRGLWSRPDPIPPWRWRAARESVAPTARPDPPAHP